MISGKSHTLNSNARTKRSSVAIASATVLVVLAWFVLSHYVVPPVIERAYRGQSLALFNHLITGQISHPLAEYLAEWRTISWRLLQGLIAAGLLTVVAIQPGVQMVLWGRTSRTPEDSSTIVPLP